MKNFLWLLVFTPIISFSQEKTEEVVVVKSNKQIEEFTNSLGSDELRVDFLDLLLFPALTVAYEKSKNSFSGFGSTLFLNLGNDSSVGDIYTQKFALTPYYRFYFLKSEDFGGKGIFAEVFTKYLKPILLALVTSESNEYCSLLQSVDWPVQLSIVTQLNPLSIE